MLARVYVDEPLLSESEVEAETRRLLGMHRYKEHGHLKHRHPEITFHQILHVLKNGKAMKNGARRGCEAKWSYGIEGRDVDGNRIRVVVEFPWLNDDEEKTLLLVTAFDKDKKE